MLPRHHLEGEIATDASAASTVLAILGLANVAIDQLATIAAVTAVPTNQMLCISCRLRMLRKSPDRRRLEVGAHDALSPVLARILCRLRLAKDQSDVVDSRHDDGGGSRHAF